MARSERVKAAVFTAVIVVSAIGLIVGAQEFRPTPPALTHGIPASITIEGPGWTINYASNETLNNTVFLFLLEAARSQHFAVVWSNWSPPYTAVFVEAIHSARNGEDGRWWVFWVDGVYSNTAADLTILRGGESILWRFTTPQGG